MMLGHYLKLAFRHLFRYRTFSLVNITGLAISLSASIVIFTFVSYEFSFDRHIPAYDRTYRIITRFEEGNYWSRTFPCYGDALAGYPEIESMTSFIQAANGIINIREETFTVPELVIVDTAFVDFFNPSMLSGRKEDIGNPDIVFITPGLAEKFFPGMDPIGEDILLRQFENNTADSLGHFTVGGIIEPLPGNTHFGYQLVFSQQGNFTDFMRNMKRMKVFNANVYLRLYNPSQLAGVESTMAEKLVPYLDGVFGPPLEAFNSKLQPLGDIHFTTGLNREPRPTTRKSLMLLMFSISILIMAVSAINLVNMMIYHHYRQRKESGVIRTFGGTAGNLFTASFTEISISVSASLVLSWVIIILIEPFLGKIFVSGWAFRPLSGRIIIAGLLTGLLVAVIAAVGSNLSGKKDSIVELLRGKPDPGSASTGTLKVLSFVQFAIVVFLLGFSLIIGRQLTYLNNKDLGYQADNVYVVRIPADRPRGNILRDEIQKLTGVISASTVHHHPADVFQQMEFEAGGKRFPFGFRMVDPDVFRTLDIDIIKSFGQNTDRIVNGWVINETFYKHLLTEFSEDDIAASNFNVENEEADNSKSKFLVSAVMKDFHYSSLHGAIGNFAFAIRNPEEQYNRYLVVSFEGTHSAAVLSHIQELMQRYYPGRFYDVFMLEDKLSDQYRSDRVLSSVISIFCFLSIILAGLGLFGIAAFITQQRTKEIGMRKVCGARSGQILFMLNMGFMKWVLIAVLIASPVTIWATGRWLENFAYRTDFGWWIMLVAGLIAAAIALVTVSGVTWLAARQDPVKSLRHE